MADREDIPEGRIALTGEFPGPHFLPDLTEFESVEASASKDVLMIRALTAGGHRMFLPILNQAVVSLVNAPEVAMPFGTLTIINPVFPDEIPDAAEMPLIHRFVCFRRVDDQWRAIEFLAELDQRLLVPFSLEAFHNLLETLKKLPGVVTN